MKKLDPTLVKGKEAEDRCIRLIRSLKQELPIRRIRHTGTRLDRLGIDIIVHFRSDDGTFNVKVPVEVKSSFTGVMKYHQKHPDCVEGGVILVVVARHMSDEHISNFLRKEFVRVLREKKDFNPFIKCMRSKAEKLSLPRFYKAILMKLQRGFKFKHFFSRKDDDERMYA